MNIQIYALKKNFDVQKAERYFKERRVPYTMVDLAKHTLGKREMETFARKVGIRNLIDTSSKLYETHYIRNLTGESTIIEALIAEPKLLKTPIVRNGQDCTVGFAPEIWEGWK